MLDLSRLDLQGIATALQDQTDHEHRWLFNPQTGEIVVWTTDDGRRTAASTADHRGQLRLDQP